jgi:hypothetical protein
VPERQRSFCRKHNLLAVSGRLTRRPAPAWARSEVSFTSRGPDRAGTPELELGEALATLAATGAERGSGVVITIDELQLVQRDEMGRAPRRTEAAHHRHPILLLADMTSA